MSPTEQRLPWTIQASILGCMISIGLIAWMFAGGLVSYAPTVSRSTIQNIYLSRMLWYGAAIVGLQVVIIVMLFRTDAQSKSGTKGEP